MRKDITQTYFKQKLAITFLFMLFSYSLSAQCYKSNLDVGKQQYNSGKYQTAMATFQKSLKCPDAKGGSEANQWITKCKSKITEQKKVVNENRFAEEQRIAEDEIFTVVEVNPMYPGGDELRMKYLQENIKYPQMARESGIQGTVYVTFVVEPNGSITNIKILRGIGGGCDEEATRVVSQMPKWVPGKQHGENVRVQFNMPIKFVLAG